MNIKETLNRPIAKVSAGLGGILAILNPDVLVLAFDALVASGPQLFSVASIGALTLPRILPPETTADWIVVAAGTVFLVYLARQINDNFEDKGL